MASVRRDEFAVGVSKILGGDHRLRAAAQKLGPVGAEPGSQPVELRNQFIVELHEHFASRHEHMLSHMTFGTLAIVANTATPPACPVVNASSAPIGRNAATTTADTPPPGRRGVRRSTGDQQPRDQRDEDGHDPCSQASPPASGEPRDRNRGRGGRSRATTSAFEYIAVAHSRRSANQRFTATGSRTLPRAAPATATPVATSTAVGRWISTRATSPTASALTAAMNVAARPMAVAELTRSSSDPVDSS